jgi:hypothetical protein
MIKHRKLLCMLTFLIGIGVSLFHLTWIPKEITHNSGIKPLEFRRQFFSAQNSHSAFPSKITSVYHKFRTKSLHVNFHSLNNDSYRLVTGRLSENLAWYYHANLLSSFTFFHGSRAPPVIC